MRYIGSKNLLLENIKQVIDENINEPTKVFCDIFSGTGIVSRFFKQDYSILSNDLLYFSYILQFASIENNQQPTFKKLKNIGISDPLSFFNNQEVSLKDILHPPLSLITILLIIKVIGNILQMRML